MDHIPKSTLNSNYFTLHPVSRLVWLNWIRIRTHGFLLARLHLLQKAQTENSTKLSQQAYLHSTLLHLCSMNHKILVNLTDRTCPTLNKSYIPTYHQTQEQHTQLKSCWLLQRSLWQPATPQTSIGKTKHE